MAVDPDVTVATLIEVIFGFIKYRVKYGKAWRAKQRAMQLLWGDWKEAYGLLPRILTAMLAKNAGMEFYPWHENRMDRDGVVMKHVLVRVYWSFEQCIEAFKHCRPVISEGSVRSIPPVAPRRRGSGWCTVPYAADSGHATTP